MIARVPGQQSARWPMVTHFWASTLNLWCVVVSWPPVLPPILPIALLRWVRSVFGQVSSDL